MLTSYLRSLRNVLFFGLLLATLLFVGKVAAQSETELRSTADYTYGQVMRFRLQVRDLGEVTGVTLYFRPHTSAESYAVEIPVEPGSQQDVGYALDLTETRLPPFSTVTYWWELQGADGATLRVPERVINYVDDQFSWQWLTKTDPEGSGPVTVQWTGDNPTVGETAFAILLDSLGRLSPYVKLKEVQPFNLFIYPSSADLGSAMRLAGQDWQAGQSLPELGVLLVTSVNPATSQGELTDGIGRELTEQLLYQAYPDSYQQIPRWLHVGLAQIAAGGPDDIAQALLAEALANRQTPALADLCANYPALEAETDLTRAQSGAYLAYISERYGPEAVTSLLDAFASGADCDSAFGAVLQTSTSNVQAAWRAQFRSPSSQRTLLSQAIIWVLLILAGFVIAALLVLRRGNSRSKSLN